GRVFLQPALSNRCASDTPRNSHDLRSARIRHSRWAHDLRRELSRCVPPNRHLHGQNSQGHYARGPGCHAADRVRACHQHWYCEGARPRRAADPARPRRRGDRMTRREFVTLLGGAAAWPLAARAQQAGKIHKVGYLSPSLPSVYFSLLFDDLRELGWIEGKNVTFEYRFAENRLERLPELASELVRLNVDVIVGVGTLGPLAAKRATTTIPI